MALLSVIRRWHFRQHIPIREIERRTGLSRNTIRKYLRNNVVEPRFRVPDRPSKLDPFAEKLSTWLRIETGKSRKQRRTVRQMHADLVVLGFEGNPYPPGSHLDGKTGSVLNGNQHAEITALVSTGLDDTHLLSWVAQACHA